MGCCFSTTKTPKSNNPPNTIPSTHHRRSPESDLKDRAPPPPPAAFEEETVKEVLSETPIVKLPTPALTENNETTHKRIEVHEVKDESTAVIKPSDENHEIVSEISEVSEMCSFTESFSTTMTEKRDDADGEVTQRSTHRIQRSPVNIPKKRPYTGEHAGVRERGVRSPARRSAPSPEKRSHVTSRSVPGRPGTNQRRVIGSPNGVRRDPGEGSGRRSRSPATRVDGGPRENVRYRSPTASTSSRGGRSPARTVEKGGGTSPVRTVEYSGSLEKGNDGVSQQTSESLENPLVSLECFIFL